MLVLQEIHDSLSKSNNKWVDRFYDIIQEVFHGVHYTEFDMQSDRFHVKHYREGNGEPIDYTKIPSLNMRLKESLSDEMQEIRKNLQEKVSNPSNDICLVICDVERFDLTSEEGLYSFGDGYIHGCFIQEGEKKGYYYYIKDSFKDPLGLHIEFGEPYDMLWHYETGSFFES